MPCAPQWIGATMKVGALFGIHFHLTFFPVRSAGLIGLLACAGSGDGDAIQRS
jgi:hypothetical protein